MADYVDHWYHVDMANASYARMKLESRTEHLRGAPGTQLSVYQNDAGTEALVKVRAKPGFTPSWAVAPFLVREFTAADHADAVALVHAADWDGR
mgnify:CR=1 FL=1|tara:strand:+ start:4274 stop:4555 length:282 start_codon:yes stop_codon:yes gene_type:complete